MTIRKPAHLLLVDDDPGLLKLLGDASSQRRLQRGHGGKRGPGATRADARAGWTWW